MRHDYVLEASATVPSVVYNLQGISILVELYRPLNPCVIRSQVMLLLAVAGVENRHVCNCYRWLIKRCSTC